MKRFHATCTDSRDGRGGIGGRAMYCSLTKRVYRGTVGGGVICVIEVSDEDAPKLLAAGLNPVDEPETDEAFVKRHYPDAWLRGGVTSCCIRYGDSDSTPLGFVYASGVYATPTEAWAQAAKEVRESLSKKQPQPQPQQNHQTPAPSPTETKAMQPQTQQADTLTPKQPQSWMQRLRDDAKQLGSDAQAKTSLGAFFVTMLLAATAAGIAHFVARQDVPWIVFLSIIAPMIAACAVIGWIESYAIATQDYVPPVRVAKAQKVAQTGGAGGQLTLVAGSGGCAGGIGITATPQPRRRSIIGRFIWWAVSSAAYTTLGYAACWAQSNWTSICFDLGAFLQRVAQ